MSCLQSIYTSKIFTSWFVCLQCEKSLPVCPMSSWGAIHFKYNLKLRTRTQLEGSSHYHSHVLRYLSTMWTHRISGANRHDPFQLQTIIGKRTGFVVLRSDYFPYQLTSRSGKIIYRRITFEKQRDWKNDPYTIYRHARAA